MADLADYLDLTAGQASEQFSALLHRRSVVPGERQVAFTPVETLLCLAASFLINHRHYGGSTVHRAPDVMLWRAVFSSRKPNRFCWRRPGSGNTSSPFHVLRNCGDRCVFRIHVARPLADAVRTDPMARQYYGCPPLHDVLLLPADAEPPARKYLDWHRQKIFVA